MEDKPMFEKYEKLIEECSPLEKSLLLLLEEKSAKNNTVYIKISFEEIRKTIPTDTDNESILDAADELMEILHNIASEDKKGFSFCTGIVSLQADSKAIAIGFNDVLLPHFIKKHTILTEAS